jgi:hypothetical protein
VISNRHLLPILLQRVRRPSDNRSHVESVSPGRVEISIISNFHR